jgi:UDPglucose 6-dehydrogenase
MGPGADEIVPESGELGSSGSLVISVVGCGYLGVVHAACLAALGHRVIAVDTNETRIKTLEHGKAPFYEPDLAALLTDGVKDDRLAFTSDFSAAEAASVHFICVGTPQKNREDAADLQFIDSAVASLLPSLKPHDLVVGKSTVPVGTASKIAERVGESEPAATVAWNPEFLREGTAVRDTLRPERIVYGMPETDAAQHAKMLLDRVYRKLLDDGVPLIVTDYSTAELVKVAANSFLATKVSFMNAMAEFCEAAGGDVTQLAEAIGYDPRIGRQFLNAGLGFGGGCLPKDIRAFMARAGELGVDQALAFLKEIDSINMRRRVRMVDLAREACGGSIVGRRIAVLGAAFKPDTDDVRDSPALSVAAQMSLQGAHVLVTDPQALENASAQWPDLKFVESVEEAAYGAELVLVLTEWREYVDIDPMSLKSVVAIPRILDGRNALNPQRWREAGWLYRALGRQ